jgi:hypothetical protein
MRVVGTGAAMADDACMTRPRKDRAAREAMRRGVNLTAGIEERVERA